MENSAQFEPYEPDVVCYHSPCNDGMMAATVCATKWPSARYMPVNYNEEVDPLDFKGMKVLTVDFCFQKRQLESVLSECKGLVILDHHVTSQEILKRDGDALGIEFMDESITLDSLDDDAKCCYFDMNRSGAVLTRDWVFADRTLPAELSVPDLMFALALSQDHDLWRLEMRDTNEFYWGLQLHTNGPIELAAKFKQEGITRQIIDAGRSIKEFIEIKAKMAVDEARPVTVRNPKDGHLYDAMAASVPTYMFSHVGGSLARKSHSGLGMCWNWSRGVYYVGFRSYERYGIVAVDCSKLAESYGGGGHKKAAGCRMNAEELNAILSSQNR